MLESSAHLWQIGVDEAARGKSLVMRLLEEVWLRIPLS